MKRIQSSPEMDPDTEQNKNIQWVHGVGLMLFYLFLCFAGRWLVGLFVGVGLSWTLLNVVHSIITFFFLHVLKGVPFAGIEYDQGRFDKQTLWEQLDSGAQYTKTKKFLTICPIVWFMLAVLFNHFATIPFFLNLLALLPSLLGKLPITQQLMRRSASDLKLSQD